MYNPKPIDTSNIELPKELNDLIEHLAENNHDIWASQRIKEGWTFGPKRDDDKKFHPDLVPYNELSESEKEYDRKTSIETIKAVIASGYSLIRKAAEDQRNEYC